MIPVNIEVAGGGSLGLLLAARLAPSCRLRIRVRTAEQAERINRDGIEVSSGMGETVRYPVEAEDSERPSGGGGRTAFLPDWILLTVKQKDITSRLALELAERMKAGARLLCFQNGLGHVDKLAEAVPVGRIWLAVTTEGARRESPVRVRHAGSGHTAIGKADSQPSPGDWAAYGELSALLTAAQWSHGFKRDIQPAVWEKLIINAVINPLTAALRVSNGELLQTEARLGLMKDLYREGVAVAEACGIRLADNFWEQIVKVCSATSANHSSMLQDVENGRETEISWISGAILEKAKEKSLILPVTEVIYRIVNGFARRNGQDNCGDTALV